MSIVRIVHPDSRTGDLLGLELGGEWFYLRPEDAAVAWLHGDPDEDLARAVADYVAAHGHKTEDA